MQPQNEMRSIAHLKQVDMHHVGQIHNISNVTFIGPQATSFVNMLGHQMKAGLKASTSIEEDQHNTTYNYMFNDTQSPLLTYDEKSSTIPGTFYELTARIPSSMMSIDLLSKDGGNQNLKPRYSSVNELNNGQVNNQNLGNIVADHQYTSVRSGPPRNTAHGWEGRSMQGSNTAVIGALNLSSNDHLMRTKSINDVRSSITYHPVGTLYQPRSFTKLSDNSYSPIFDDLFHTEGANLNEAQRRISYNNDEIIPQKNKIELLSEFDRLMPRETPPQPASYLVPPPAKRISIISQLVRQTSKSVKIGNHDTSFERRNSSPIVRKNLPTSFMKFTIESPREHLIKEKHNKKEKEMQQEKLVELVADQPARTHGRLRTRSADKELSRKSFSNVINKNQPIHFYMRNILADHFRAKPTSAVSSKKVNLPLRQQDAFINEPKASVRIHRQDAETDSQLLIAKQLFSSPLLNSRHSRSEESVGKHLQYFNEERVNQLVKLSKIERPFDKQQLSFGYPHNKHSFQKLEQIHKPITVPSSMINFLKSADPSWIADLQPK